MKKSEDKITHLKCSAALRKLSRHELLYLETIFSFSCAMEI